MSFIRFVCAWLIWTLFALPAQACWNTPSAACFAQMWQDQTLAYHSNGPKVERLYNLIDWGVLPHDAKTARVLLAGIEYDDLVAHHAAEAGPGIVPERSEAEQALRLLLGLSGTEDPPEVNTDYLVEIHALSLLTQDKALSDKWHRHLPDYMRDAPRVSGLDGAAPPSDPYLEAQDKAVLALTRLRDGQIEQALATATGLHGEPGFLVWLALTRHAIAAEDTVLLARAIEGLNHAQLTKLDRPFDEEVFQRNLEAAEAEYARSGDPDALTQVFESADPSAHDLPVSAAITVALAQRYLSRLADSQADDGFGEALTATQRALRNRDDEDDATPMLNARTALRLGMLDEAEQLITMMDADYPGVPGFFLYDLPELPAPWAEAWLTRMVERFDRIAAQPDHYDSREYWSIWLDQDALTSAIDITRWLALYDRRDESFAFAARAENYLRALPDLYPGMARDDLAKLYDRETAVFLYPPEVAIPRLRQSGADETQILYAFARAHRPVIALKLLSGQSGYRNLAHWMDHLVKVPDYLQEDYMEHLRPLIEAEATRLIQQGYPDLALVHHADAVVFWAQQGDWTAARHHYQQIEPVAGTHGLALAAHHRLITLRKIVSWLSPQPATVHYPYGEFAL